MLQVRTVYLLLTEVLIYIDHLVIIGDSFHFFTSQRNYNSMELKKTSDCKISCVDLFAGAGGFSLAAHNVGINIKAAVEFNRSACDTYEANFIVGKDNPPTLYRGDIRELDPHSVLNAHFDGPEHCDIVLGGPPCQGFSIHRIKDAGVDDPRNDLILKYFEFVTVLRPKIFLMENVPGILWPRHRSYIEAFYAEGAKAQYRIHPPVILDARDFGVPQRRKRVFILGVRNDLDVTIQWPPMATHGDEEKRQENSRLLPWETAEKVFVKPLRLDDENNLHMNHSTDMVARFKATPLNGGSRSQSGFLLPCHEKHNGHSDVYGRIDPSQPGPTMTTACVNPSKGRFVHPVEHHGITARHAARFQTFHDQFVFKGGLMAAGSQIGNAVPIVLGEILLGAIKRALAEGN